ncbi:NUDIX domain-containing protein [Streptomyces sp. NPDC048196]|uniref:NUDIX domain-containing protein n=1 Tax=Streptomyces sp. NPDC048196 TaxID=3154712 RepID=UPI0033E3DA67
MGPAPTCCTCGTSSPASEPGSWSLLGGGHEPGDRPLEETVRRELREEAGLDIPDLVPFAVQEAGTNDGIAVRL